METAGPKETEGCLVSRVPQALPVRRVPWEFLVSQAIPDLQVRKALEASKDARESLVRREPVALEVSWEREDKQVCLSNHSCEPTFCV